MTPIIKKGDDRGSLNDLRRLQQGVFMILGLLTLLISLKTQALSLDVTQTQLLNVTGISQSDLYAQTEKALDTYVFLDEGGMSCGLDNYEIETFNIIEGSRAKPTRFEVVAQVEGPGSSCNENDQYQCYVTWKLTQTGWQTVFVECDETLYEE